jgi:hypothetical protein
MERSAPEETSHIPLIAGSAEASSVETAAAIDQAVEKNDDPEVAEILDDAALAAQQTVSRVGWLRGTLNRLFSHPG